MPTRTLEIIGKRSLENGLHEITVAANDRVGSGPPINLRNIDIDTYRRNPVVLWMHDQSQLPIAKRVKYAWSNETSRRPSID